ncbi:MAG: hypothetical protein K0S58_3550 [Nitrospira sp.]|jgi:hypothetical protein|nr:hypothetical protein [Nitrospira sp.]
MTTLAPWTEDEGAGIGPMLGMVAMTVTLPAVR